MNTAVIQSYGKYQNTMGISRVLAILHVNILYVRRMIFLISCSSTNAFIARYGAQQR